MNEVNFKAVKRDRVDLKLHCRLQIVDCRLEKQKQPATNKQQTANEKSESEN